ncbi:hypothetical protein ABID56_001480 [Alkalibacillus flavidus]|uniref:DUF4321 domain-containing protein n=1 Tax=Alkalibacillus flavidus TaxID=546021 RepID=A0ABV2KXH3_9BACI
MNKILFFFSNLLVVIGLCVLFVTNILNEVMPMLGRAAFQASMAGSYSPHEYQMNFNIVNLISGVLIIGGVVASYKIYVREK